MADDTSAQSAPPVAANDINSPPTEGDTQSLGVATVIAVEARTTTRLPKGDEDATRSKDDQHQEGTEAKSPNSAAMNETEPAGDEDTKMTDAPETETVQEPIASPGANGTPAASKKTKRKSGAGVPEHKQKKLGKKKSQKLTHTDAQPGDYFFARLKGHAPWPAIICDEEMLPMSLLTSRPVTAKRPDGTYRDDFADGGKRVNERSFPIMYFETNEFGWMPNTDLHELDLDTIGDQPEKGKSKALYRAYQVAAEKHDLEYFKGLLRDHQQALQADAEASVETKPKKPKSRRKSKDVATDSQDVEMEDVDEDLGSDNGTVTTKGKTKKRKKDVESDAEDSKPAKTPKRSESTKKTATKLKLTTPKTPNGVDKATPGSKSAKTKTASTKKSKAKQDSDEEAIQTPKAEEKPLSVAEQREKKQKELLYLRHRLQKGFLTRDQMPKEEDMKTMADYIAKLETYGDLEVSIIRATKIHKVLKAIMKLSSIPKDEEFNFRQRSHALLQSWNQSLAKEPDTPTAGSSAEKEGATTNGVSKGDERDSDKEEGSPTDAEEAGQSLASKIADGVEKVRDEAADMAKSAKEGFEKTVESVSASVMPKPAEESEADNTKATGESEQAETEEVLGDEDVKSAAQTKAVETTA
ncbi:MAG: hypothetical protein M1833_002474 [Piccolia ochrophora]|nr:MAG: hypothetical protein M1833_002474 [Piccolia ochrophora]